MAITKSEIETYLNENKSLVLATVGLDGIPEVRHLGAYGVEGANVYFNTAANSGKIAQIQANSNVTVLFHHEGQLPPALKNVTVYGEAEILFGTEFERGVEIIKKRRPQAQINPEVNAVIRVNAKKIKLLDFAGQEKLVTIAASELV